MSHKLLIVEDNESLNRIMTDTFKDEGFKVISALDGEEGLELAKKENPDLILLDILMPKKNGNEMLKELRQTPEGKDVKVIVLTNSDSGENVVDFMNLGVADYLTKADWELSDLVKKVKEKLGA